MRFRKAWTIALTVWAIVYLLIALSVTRYIAFWRFNGYWGDQSGGSQLNFALYIARGVNYYTDASAYPMLTPQTPGLFPLLIAPFVKLWGPSLLYGSILGALSLCLSIASVMSISYQLIKDRVFAIGSIGILLSFPRLAEPLAWNRPDSLAFALTIAAVAVATIAAKRNGYSFWILSAFLAVAATYSKQQSIVGFVAIGLYLLLSARFKELAVYALVAGVVGLAPFAVLQDVTHGNYLRCITTMTAGMPRFGLEHWLKHVAFVVVGTTPTLALASFGVLKDFRSRDVTPCHFLCLLAWIAGVATVWNIGGSFQYFGWFLVSLAPLGVRGLHVFLQDTSSKLNRWGHLAGIMLIAWPCLCFLFSPWQTLKDQWFDQEACSPAYRSEVEAAFNTLASLDGEVLTDSFTGLMVLQGRTVDVELGALARMRGKRVWNSIQLEQDLSRGRWDHIILAIAPSAFEMGALGLDDPTLNAALHSAYCLLGDRGAVGVHHIVVWQRCSSADSCAAPSLHRITQMPIRAMQ